MQSSPPLPLEVTVLLPAFNEEKAIGPLIDEVRDVMLATGMSFEILVVDDASTDRTPDEAEKRGATVLRRHENGGSGAARKTGVRAARGEVVVMLDADGTYPPREIPRLLALMDRYEQVNGARTSEQGTLRWLRTPTKWAIRKLACYLTQRDIPDLNTGLKAFRRRTMLRYLHLVPNGFSCVTTMTLAFLTNDHPTAYVPVTYLPRIGKSKFHPLRDTSAYVQTVVRMALYFKPLMIFLPLGTALLALGLALTVWHRVTLGHMQLHDIVVLSAALATLALGLIADLIVVHARRPETEDPDAAR